MKPSPGFPDFRPYVIICRNIENEGDKGSCKRLPERIRGAL